MRSMLENNVGASVADERTRLTFCRQNSGRVFHDTRGHLYIDNFGKREKGVRGSERDEGEDGRAIALYHRTLRTSAIDLSDLINENSRTRSIRFNYAGT